MTDKERYNNAGLVLGGFFMLGIGIGMWHCVLLIGTVMGLGAGFLAMASIMIFLKQKR